MKKYIRTNRGIFESELISNFIKFKIDNDDFYVLYYKYNTQRHSFVYSSMSWMGKIISMSDNICDLFDEIVEEIKVERKLFKRVKHVIKYGMCGSKKVAILNNGSWKLLPQEHKF